MSASALWRVPFPYTYLAEDFSVLVGLEWAKWICVRGEYHRLH